MSVMPQLMRAAVLERPGAIRLSERAVPSLSPEDVLVRVREVGICGSDVHYYRHGRIGRYVVEQPLVLGHEPSGEIVQTGAAADPSRIGQRVAIEPGVPCRHCENCTTGRYNLCPFMAFMATPPVDGALSDYVAVPADFAHPIPDSMSLAEAALIEPAPVAVHAARIARAGAGMACAVFGLGPVGLLVCQMLRAFGVARVTAVDPVAVRRTLALGLGADVALDPGTTLLPPPGLDGFDRAFDASGSTAGMKATVAAARRGGVAVWVGLPRGDELPIPAATLIDKELELRGVFRYANDHPLAIELVATGRVDVKPLITHRFPLSDAAEALDLVEHQRDGVVKALIEP